MDCIIDFESYQTLKQSYLQLLATNNELEVENESLIQCNRLLKRLTNSLENIKQNLEQKVLIINTNLGDKSVDNLLPFDGELKHLDEEYCHLKCLLNELEFKEELNETIGEEDSDSNGQQHRQEDCVVGHQAPDESAGGLAHKNLLNDSINECLNETNVDSINDFTNEFTNNESIDESIDENSCVQYVVHHLTSASAVGDQQHNHSLITTIAANDDSTTTAVVGVHELTASSLISGFDILNNSSSADDSQLVKRPKNRRSKAQAIPGMKRFKCSWDGCAYQTDSSGNFQKHYRIHTGEKPYKCDFDGCDYSCSDPGSIKEHKRIHCSEKQFACEWPGCSWKFSTYKLLKNHRRACHTGEKPHKCDWPGCDKSFLAPYALRTHKLKHTGDRPHKCDIIGCRAAFTRSTDLMRHKRETHCTERQYLCEHENCNSRFYRKDDLRHHVKRKHDCPQFGRRKKQRLLSDSSTKEGQKSSLKLMRKKSSLMSGTTSAGSDGTDGLDEPKVVIDLNVAKVNQLRKSIQINFV